MKADLHMHSYYSDGLLSPDEVAQAAVDAGAQVVALTDHDTVDGVAEMDSACAARGIKNIHGVEISTTDGCEVHILGLNVNVVGGAFLALLERNIAERERRIDKIVSNLNRDGLTISRGDVERHAHRVLSRGHVGRALFEAGYTATFKETFDKYLYEGSPYYEYGDFPTPEEAVEAIHRAGGVAVLAHPMRIKKPDGEKDALIKRLAAAGLDGLEASYKLNPPDTLARYRNLAARYGLFVTNGGDFHGGTSTIIPRDLDKDTATRLRLL